MKFVIISASLNKKSRSFVMAQQALQIFKQHQQPVEFIDLRQYDLPFCDAGESFDHPQVQELKHKIQQASALLVAGPVYNYGMNAALKNLFDLTGAAWEGKIIGLMAIGGGKSSYMAPMNFLNNLMLNARCVVIPRFVYALEKDIEDDQLKNSELKQRIEHLVKTCIEWSSTFNH